MGNCCGRIQPIDTSYGVFHYRVKLGKEPYGWQHHSLRAGPVNISLQIQKGGEYSGQTQVNLNLANKSRSITGYIHEKSTNARVKVTPYEVFTDCPWPVFRAAYGPVLDLTIELRKAAPNSILPTSSLVDSYTRQQFTDCKIRTGSGFYGAHRIILSKSSNVLATKLENKKNDEKSETEIDLSDHSAVTVNRFLLICYGADTSMFDELPFNDLLNLLTLSDRLDTPSAVSACLEKIQKNLSVQTLPQLTSYTSQHIGSKLHDKLNNVCASYIGKNPHHAVAMLATTHTVAAASSLVLTVTPPSAPPSYSEST